MTLYKDQFVSINDVTRYDAKLHRIYLKQNRFIDVGCKCFFFDLEDSFDANIIDEANEDGFSMVEDSRYFSLKLNFSSKRKFIIDDDDGDDGYIMVYVINKEDIQGGKVMSKNDLVSTMLCMKMLGGASSGSDLDLGKMYLLQQMSDGGKIQLTDVMKSKLIGKLKLDKDDDDMPLDKIMLIQMLDNDSEIDVSQLMVMKMMGTMFEEKKD